MNIDDYFRDKNSNTLYFRLNQIKRWVSVLSECLPNHKELLTHCHPVNIDKTSLIIMVDSPYWIMQIRALIPQILPKLKNYSDLKFINSICCKVSPNIPKNRRRNPKLDNPIISEKAKAILKQEALHIKDSRLKAIFLKMAEDKND